MSDKQLEYWYDWSICGPDSETIFNFKKKTKRAEEDRLPQSIIKKRFPGAIEKERLNDIDYLCDQIDEYPNITLMNEDFWYTITMLRQKALKDASAVGELRRVCEAIQGDGRAKKNQERLIKLIGILKRDINSFKKILELKNAEEKSIYPAIGRFLSKDDQPTEVLDQEKNYQKIIPAYYDAYKELSSHELTKKEIFCFFKNAAEHIFYPNVNVEAEPDGRHLTFVKQEMWFVRGNYIKFTVDDRAVDI